MRSSAATDAPRREQSNGYRRVPDWPVQGHLLSVQMLTMADTHFFDSIFLSSRLVGVPSLSLSVSESVVGL